MNPNPDTGTISPSLRPPLLAYFSHLMCATAFGLAHNPLYNHSKDTYTELKIIPSLRPPYVSISPTYNALNPLYLNLLIRTLA